MVLSLEAVRSERLALPLWTAGDVAAIRGRGESALAGERAPYRSPDGLHWHHDFPRTDDVDAAWLWREGDVWGPRSIVRGSTVLGSIGFFGPPEPVPAEGHPDGANHGAAATSGVLEVEMGYGLVREAWGWGFATEAVRALLAETDAMGVRVRASVRPDNAASLRVLAKCGFTILRGTTEDGELVMVRPLPKPVGS